MAKILIKNGRIWDGESFFYSDVLTDGELIAKIEPNIGDEADYVYDATGKTVSAGFVDIHVHMLVTRGDMYGIQAEMSCFPFGVTAAADAARNVGERAIMDSFMLKNLLFVWAPIKENKADLDEISRALESYGDKAVGIKVYFDTGNPELVDTAPLAEICEFAKSKGLCVMAHCTDSPTSMPEILETLNKGDILTHSFHGGKNNASLDNFESLKKAQKRGVIIDTGFAGNVHTDFDVLGKAVSAGIIPDTISTDITKFSAYIRGGRYGMTMCMSMAKHLGLNEEDIFRAVTSSPARVLGKEEKWGSLKVGRSADIAVLEYTDEGFSLTDKAGNHIESKTGYRCTLTIADGQIVYRH